MAKATKKTSRSNRAGKRPGPGAIKKSISKTARRGSPMSPRKRAKVLKQLSKIGPRSSRPTDVGPHLDLSFDVPVHSQKQRRKRKVKKVTSGKSNNRRP